MWSSVDYIRGRTMFARIASRVLNLSTRQCMKPSQIDARSFARLCLPERQTLTSKMKLTSNLAPSPLSLPAWRHMSSQTTTRRPRKNSKKISTPEGSGADASSGKDAEEEPQELPRWEFDKPSEFSSAGRQGEPTPILDAYERSRDPAEMERLLKMSFEALPPRDGPRRNNHKRRQHQKYRTIRNIRYKVKAEKKAAYERKLQKIRERKAREAALFATWRGTDANANAVAEPTS